MSVELEKVKGQVAAAKAGYEHELERLVAELSFAESLCELQPAQARRWRPLIAKAAALVGDALAGRTPRRPRDLVADVEKLLAPLAKPAKAYTIYCVGHAHIDMNWMWSWPETVAVTHDSFATVLRLMEEFPQFHFTQSQASVYRIIEEHNPEMLAEIARRVKEGRWEVVASHWVEADKNMAGGESLCRHLLYTRRYMQRLFGLAPEEVPIDWSPDTFGHAATVPSYLVRGGVRYLYLHRPGTQGPKRPRAFHWVAPDGSRVLAKNDMECGYNGTIAPEMVNILVNFCRDTGLRFGLYVYGVGDHGGGPTRKDLLRGLDMQAWPVFPTVAFSTARTFFERLEHEGGGLPVLDCELNYEFAGCYTTQSLIKKANRLGENRLRDAEMAALAAAKVGGPAYPSVGFEAGWRDTLFNHFHDILPGSGVHDTRTYTHGLFQKTMAATSMIETRALRALAGALDTSAATDPSAPALPPSALMTSQGGGAGFQAANGGLSQAEQTLGSGRRPLMLFNPVGCERHETVEAILWENSRNWTGPSRHIPAFSVHTPDGDTLPAQTVETGSYWGHDFSRVAFPARVGAFGYALYTITEEKTADVPARAWQLGGEHHCAYSSRERQQEGLENDLVLVELDMTTGGIRRLVDKAGGVELISPQHPAPVLEYAVERSHGMSAWLVDHTGPAERPAVKSVRRKDRGPYKASLEVAWRIRSSDFTMVYELRAGDPNLYMSLSGTWFERGTPETGIPVLRLALPLALEGAKPSYEIPFGAVERQTVAGEEVPALQWARVTGRAGARQAGCLLANDGKHGHSLDGGTLRVTLIHSSYDPDPLPEIGRHEMQFALRPFAASAPVSEAIHAGQCLNHALRVVGTGVHKGSLPAVAELLTVSPKGVVLSGLKMAEDGQGLIARLFEPNGKAATATLELNPRLLGTVRRAVEVDLVERDLPASSARVAGNKVTVKVPARGIASLRIELAG